jgi:hypothetical protein
MIKVDKLTRFIERDKEYTAILYEYIEEGQNDADVVQEAVDFFWLVGFSFTLSQLPQNWKSGVLIDLCDIAPPRGYGWFEKSYRRGPYSAALMLQQPEGEKHGGHNKEKSRDGFVPASGVCGFGPFCSECSVRLWGQEHLTFGDE